MSTSARSVRFDDSSMWVDLSDGRVIAVPLAWFPRLLHATPQQRVRRVHQDGHQTDRYQPAYGTVAECLVGEGQQQGVRAHDQQRECCGGQGAAER